MRKRSVGAGLLVATAALLPARAEDPPAPGNAPKPGELVLRLETGRRVAFSRVVTVRTEHKAGKKKAVGSGECRTDLELVVGKRAEDGSTAIDVRALRSRGFWEHTDEPRVEFDTATAAVDKAGRAWQIVKVAAPGPFSVRPDGCIVEIAALAEEQARAARLPQRDPVFFEFQSHWMSSWALADFAATWPALPPKRMGAGGFFEADSIPPWAIAALYRLPLRHELKLLNDTRAVLEWKGAVDDIDPVSGGGGGKPKDGQAKPPKVRASGFAANAEVDRADGLVLKSSARFTLVRTQTFSVDGNSVEGTGSFEWEAVMERATPAPVAGATPGDPPPAPPKDGSGQR